MDKDIELGDHPASNPRSLVEAQDDMATDLSLRAVVPVNVHARNLSFEVDVSPSGFSAFAARINRTKLPEQEPQFKTILEDVSLFMPSGSLTAIIGGSGSGKTSMLNIMSHRMSGTRLRSTGSILYNGNSKLSSIRSAYVMQQDVLLPTLTVRETLQYAADLRLPPPTTAEERRKAVEDVILELSLKDCAGTRIGNNIYKGCSGGEKRRTSLGVQLLANPSVLFLDEVTTGLDATSALQLIRTLKVLASKGRTIIVSIHQPRSEIWDFFDGVLLLTMGSSVYSGQTKDCVQYFEDLGYDLPPFVNPAEHLVDLAAVDTRSVELEATSLARVENLKRAWKSSSEIQPPEALEEKPPLEEKSVDDEGKKSRSALGRQIHVLTARTLLVTYRDPMGMAGSLLEAVSMGIITGWIFVNLGGDLAGIRSREGGLYIVSSLQGYLILLFETYRLTLDIELFDRERGEGVVSVSSFLISRRLARLFIEDVPVPLIFSIITYFMMGFRLLASQFFAFFAITLLSQYIAIATATVCVAISRNFAGASLIANMIFTLQSVCSGKTQI